MHDKNSIRKSQYHALHMTNATAREILEGEYESELNNFDIAKWELPVRAARLSAAIKRYKTTVMLDFIFENLPAEFQLSPRLVKHLCKAWFERTGTEGLIVHVFGGYLEMGNGRVSKEVWKQLEPTIEEHKRSARKYMRKALAEAEEVKANYQAQIRLRNREPLDIETKKQKKESVTKSKKRGEQDDRHTQ